MQIIKYEINKNILTIGFKEIDNKNNPFVVYTDIAYDSNLVKQELLQKAYELVKHTLDYEKTLTDHSIITDKVGEEFTPDVVKTTNIEIVGLNTVQSNNTNIITQYKGIITDQYNNVLNNTIVWSIEPITENVSINTIGELNVGIITEDKNIVLKATCENISSTLSIKILKPQIIEEKVNQDLIDVYEGMLNLDTRLKKLEGGN